MNKSSSKQIITAVKDQSRVRGYTHRFYTYPAGFSPVFVEAAIQSLTKKNDLVLDPFMGGGTTIIEALRANRKVVGIDLNPISSFFHINFILWFFVTIRLKNDQKNIFHSKIPIFIQIVSKYYDLSIFILRKKKSRNFYYQYLRIGTFTISKLLIQHF